MKTRAPSNPWGVRDAEPGTCHQQRAPTCACALLYGRLHAQVRTHVPHQQAWLPIPHPLLPAGPANCLPALSVALPHSQPCPCPSPHTPNAPGSRHRDDRSDDDERRSKKHRRHKDRSRSGSRSRSVRARGEAGPGRVGSRACWGRSCRCGGMASSTCGNVPRVGAAAPLGELVEAPVCPCSGSFAHGFCLCLCPVCCVQNQRRASSEVQRAASLAP